MFASAREGAGNVKPVGNGLYLAKCWQSGVEKSVLVDSLLPCIDARPAFGGSVNQVEDLLLQKAYAQLHGSYEWILSADWPKAQMPHEALGWQAPDALDQEHPLAALAMGHA